MEYMDDFSFAKPYLTAGESILWRGKPGTGNLVTAQDVLMIPFSLLWCGFAIFWLVTVVTSGAPAFFGLFGVPFVAVGLYLVFGRFLWTAYIRKRTAYVITNKKIIRARGNRIDMLEGKNMPAAQTTVFRDGRATILFGHLGWQRMGGTHYYNGSVRGFALENVSDVAQIQQALSAMER